MREVVSPESVSTKSPLSPCIKANGFLFCSGQLPIDPKTGVVVVGGVREQTKQVLENLALILSAGGSELSRAVKVGVYMKDLSDFGIMNEIYRQFFPAAPPARTTVGGVQLARPGCLLEIDLVALA